MNTLEIDPQTVYFIMMKARELDFETEALDPESEADDDDEGSRATLEDFDNDPVVQQIKQTIESLNEDQQAELVALTWVGRGDFSTDEWAEAVTTALQRHTGPTADYLLGTPLLSDYLEEGFTQLGYVCEDYEDSRS